MCPVCDGVRFTTSSAGGLSVRRCLGCDLLIGDFADERRASYATIDTAAYAQSIGVVRRAQSKSIVGFVQAYSTSGEWLDVGCGYGHVLEEAQAASYAVRGIEPNATAAAAARQRIARVEHGFLTESTPSADIISTLDVLEHLQDVNAFAQLIRRKVRRAWVIKVPSSDGLFFRVAHALRIKPALERLWQSKYEHPHTVYFNEATLTRFLEKHGFDVLSARYLQEVPTDTVVDRLRLDAAIPRWVAYLAVPVFFLINLIERLRSRSDALVVIARPRSEVTG